MGIAKKDGPNWRKIHDEARKELRHLAGVPDRMNVTVDGWIKNYLEDKRASGTSGTGTEDRSELTRRFGWLLRLREDEKRRQQKAKKTPQEVQDGINDIQDQLGGMGTSGANRRAGITPLWMTNRAVSSNLGIREDPGSNGGPNGDSNGAS